MADKSVGIISTNPNTNVTISTLDKPKETDCMNYVSNITEKDDIKFCGGTKCKYFGYIPESTSTSTNAKCYLIKNVDEKMFQTTLTNGIYLYVSPPSVFNCKNESDCGINTDNFKNTQLGQLEEYKTLEENKIKMYESFGYTPEMLINQTMLNYISSDDQVDGVNKNLKTVYENTKTEYSNALKLKNALTGNASVSTLANNCSNISKNLIKEKDMSLHNNDKTLKGNMLEIDTLNEKILNISQLINNYQGKFIKKNGLITFLRITTIVLLSLLAVMLVYYLIKLDTVNVVKNFARNSANNVMKYSGMGYSSISNNYMKNDVNNMPSFLK
jgi:hypothetical protein